MLLKSRGIVLNTLKYNDETLIAQVLTEEVGYRTFSVRISRGRKTRSAHIFFYPLSLIELTWEERPNAKLVNPKTVSTSSPLVSIPLDPPKVTVAMFLGEFMNYALRSEPSSPELFAYLYNSILWLDAQGQRYANFHLVLLLRLTRFLGFFPERPQYIPGGYFDLQSASYTQFRPSHNNYLEPGEAQLIPTLLRMKYENMHLFHFSGAERNHFLSVINHFYRIHVPNFPELKSLAVLRDFYDGMKDF
jgi:DNA repair protein RecO (recombination protein O)